jgi:hypothetical protein
MRSDSSSEHAKKQAMVNGAFLASMGVWLSFLGWQGGAVPSRSGRLRSRAGRADLQDPLPGVGGEAGGQVQQPVAERLRLGTAEAHLVVAADERRARSARRRQSQLHAHVRQTVAAVGGVAGELRALGSRTRPGRGRRMP